MSAFLATTSFLDLALVDSELDGLGSGLGPQVVQLLDVVRDAVDSLDTTIVEDYLVLDVIRPDPQLGEVPEQVLVDDLELPAEDP